MPFASLYVNRPLLNAAEVIAWYHSQGIKQTLLPDDMHVTLAYSRQPVNWDKLLPDTRNLRVEAGARAMKRFNKNALVLRFSSPELNQRWREIREAGAIWDWPDYLPHVTITYQGDAMPEPYGGPLVFGPERFCHIGQEWEPTEKNMPSNAEAIDKAVCVSMPTVIKAHTEVGGRRIVEVEASSQEVDSEGDVILQAALLNSAQEFVATGCLDIDHISELGYQMGIPDPASYVVGRPLEVKDIGGGRTSVIGEIRRSLDGKHDPLRHRYDDLWESLQSNPPVPWYASVYGFPLDGMMENCADTGSCEHGATRYLIRGMNWRSLAFTRKPINQSLRGRARIITAKAAMMEIRKAMSVAESEGPPGALLTPTPNVSDLWAGRDCAKCGVGSMPTLYGYQDHFVKCCGMTEDVAELCAYALMHKCNMERVFSP